MKGDPLFEPGDGAKGTLPTVKKGCDAGIRKFGYGTSIPTVEGVTISVFLSVSMKQQFTGAVQYKELLPNSQNNSKKVETPPT